MVKALAFGIAACASLLALGGGGMNIANRTAAWARSGGWTNPYVTDGLVAMWDGEWNAGGGIHDPNAAVWKDLAGVHDMTIKQGVWFANHFETAKIVQSAYYPSRIDAKTMECAFVSTNNQYVNQTRFLIGNPATQLILSVYPTGQKYIQLGGTKVIAGGAGGRFPVDDPLLIHYISGCYSNGAADYAYANGERIAKDATENTWNSSSTFSLNGGLTYYYGVNKFYCIRLYSRELTADEVAHNYALDKERFGL